MNTLTLTIAKLACQSGTVRCLISGGQFTFANLTVNKGELNQVSKQQLDNVPVTTIRAACEALKQISQPLEAYIKNRVLTEP